MLFKIQKILCDAGLYTGKIDGLIGLKSLCALQKLKPDIAKKIQFELKESGYYKGNIDGIFGAASFTAFNSLIPAPKLNAENLRKVYSKVNIQFIEYINKMALEWGITTKAQMCMFLANVLVESAGFNSLRENMNYRANNLLKTFPKYVKSLVDAQNLVNQGQEAIANRVYGSRLGNTKMGDGWRFRGGGLIQTTGRYNYSILGKAINVDLINFTSRITEPEIAVKSAMYYWYSKKCGAWADKMDIDQCRYVVNGGTNGLKEVKELFNLAWNNLY